MSEKKLTFHEKRSNFDTMLGSIKKDKKNPYFKSNYADINTILAVIKEPLSVNRLRLSEKKIFDKDINTWVISLKIIDIDNPADFEETISPIIAKAQNDPQAHIAATTYARRDAHVTLLNLEQEDDDGNLASGKTQQQQKQPQQSIKQIFTSALYKAGLHKDDLVDFMGYMSGLGYDLKDDKVKQNLLSQVSKFVKEYLEMKASVNANKQ
jgi:hypothetical protein